MSMGPEYREDDFMDSIVELKEENERLKNQRKEFADLTERATVVAETAVEQLDQYRRGIKVLDKLLHDTDGINTSAWNKILDGMTLMDYLWEAGQPDKEEEDTRCQTT